MKEIKKFDRESQCPKCPTPGLHSVPPVSYVFCIGSLDDATETLKVTCNQCGYYWHMETADHKIEK